MPKDKAYYHWRTGRRGAFWARNEGMLDLLAPDLRAAFHRTVKRLHPDVRRGIVDPATGGDVVDCLAAWRWLGRAFARRGARL